VFGPFHCISHPNDYHIRELLPKRWFAYERVGVSAGQDDSWDSASTRYNLHACMIDGITPMEINENDSDSNRLEVKYRELAPKNPVEPWANISNGI